MTTQASITKDGRVLARWIDVEFDVLSGADWSGVFEAPTGWPVDEVGPMQLRLRDGRAGWFRVANVTGQAHGFPVVEVRGVTAFAPTPGCERFHGSGAGQPGAGAGVGAA